MTASPSPEPRAEDALDRLLRDYFATKLPREFPPLPLDLAPTAPARRRSSSLSRGRVVLAACVVAVLLGFGYLLSLGTPMGHKPVGLNDTVTGTGGPPHAKPAK
jgi:hypothetical protein